jgi:hypothetical protein
MAQLRLVGSSRTTILEFTGTLETDEPRVRTLDLHLAGHFASVDLLWLKVEPTGNAREWLYRFKTVDLRLWKQVIHVPAGNPTGANMDFNCDKFTLPEFQYQRELRAHIISMLDIDLVSVDVTVN